MIFREIHRLVPRCHWAGQTFLDGFLGGGSVSLFAKAQSFKVLAADIAERSIVIGRALIENSRVKLTREDVLRLASPSDEEPGRIERDYAPAVFTKEQARFIDRTLAVASGTKDPAKAALYRLLAIRVALLAHPYSQVRKGTIHRVTTGEFESITESAVYHYVDGLRLTRPEKLWQIAQAINAGVFQGEGRVVQGSILDLLPSIEADIGYFDPPYESVMSYEREYKVLDQILESTTRATSPFTSRGGAKELDHLFECAVHIPVWVLSFGNAASTLSEIEEKMRRLGRETRAIEIKYQHLPAVATEEKKEKNREFLVVGWDPAAPLLRSLSVKGFGMTDRRADAEVLEAVPDVQVEVDAVRTEGPTLKTRAADPFESGEPGFAEEAIPLGGRDAVAIDNPRLDIPDPVLTETGLDRGGEGRVLRVRHEHTVPLDARTSQGNQKEQT